MCGPHPGRILRIHHPVLQPKVASSILIVFSDGRHVGEEKVHGFGIWNGKVLHRGSEGNGRLTTALQNTAGKGVRRKRITTITSTTSPRSALINFINQGRPSRPSRRRSGDLAKRKRVEAGVALFSIPHTAPHELHATRNGHALLYPRPIPPFHPSLFDSNADHVYIVGCVIHPRAVLHRQQANPFPQHQRMTGTVCKNMPKSGQSRHTNNTIHPSRNATPPSHPFQGIEAPAQQVCATSAWPVGIKPTPPPPAEPPCSAAPSKGSVRMAQQS